MTDDLPRRIGINAIFLLPGMGGLDAYVQELVPELARAAPRSRITLYCSPAGHRHLRAADWAPAVHVVSHPLFGVRGLKAATEVLALGALAERQVDLIHSLGLTGPLRTRAANVVSIHDTIWLHGRAADATTLLWRVVIPPVARRADRIITISDHSAAAISTGLRVPRDRIDVTLLGHRGGRAAAPLPAGELRRRLGLPPGPILLMIGTRKPHKNVLGLLRAMPAILQARPDARLVLAGNPTAHEPELRAETQRLGLTETVRFLPFVEPAELEGLYAAAEVFVLPSFDEGFGLPVLEAMGRGVAVACSRAAALPEVAGDAARYFDPSHPADIAAALTELLCDPARRAELRARGLRREAQLTWQATAAATLESYARAWHAHRSLSR